MLFDRFSLRKNEPQEAPEAEAEEESDAFAEPEQAHAEAQDLAVQEPEELPEEVIAQESAAAPEEDATPQAQPPATAEQYAAPEEAAEPAEAPSDDALDSLSLAELVDRFQKRVGIHTVEEIVAAPHEEENNADGEGEHEQTNEDTETPEQ